ncbi:MAG: phosphomannose isomerase type II C-terminal cupin domain [Acidimicrobiaceae bacterium]|nr:phosphomannose isomerase type II C-terminal cupin domain [Acidimicrobiaceae bacterium]
MVVSAGKRLSYQRQARRSEHWFILAGEALVTLDGRLHQLRSGSAIDIPAETAHRIENTGEHDLVLIEVQHGQYFGEDDIVRLEDDFGRANQ